MFFIKKFYQLNLLKGSNPQTLNPYLNDFIVNSTPFFTLFDYQKVINKLFLMLYVVNNLLLYNKKFTLMSFNGEKESNLVFDSFWNNGSILMLNNWYPGVITNSSNLEIAHNGQLWDKLQIYSNFLINFGAFNTFSILNDVEKISAFLMTAVNTVDTTSSSVYCYPLNSGSLKSSVFLYFFWNRVLNNGIRTNRIFNYNKFLRTKYKLYFRIFSKKKVSTVSALFYKKLQLRIRKNNKWLKSIANRALIVKKSMKLPELTQKLLIKKIISEAFSKKGFAFHQAYYNNYYNSDVYSLGYNFFWPPTTTNFKDAIQLRLINAKLFSVMSANRRKYQEALRHAKTKSETPRYVIPWKIYRFIKRKQKALATKYIKYSKFKKKKPKFNRIFQRKKFIKATAGSASITIKQPRTFQPKFKAKLEKAEKNASNFFKFEKKTYKSFSRYKNYKKVP